MDFAILHEVLHTMGFVPTCAPHHTRNGHVSDDPRDIMYAGDEPWRPAVLDVGQDDYYHAHILDCRELAVSTYLERNIAHPTMRSRSRSSGRDSVVSAPGGSACKPRCSAKFAHGTQCRAPRTAREGRATRPLVRRLPRHEAVPADDEPRARDESALQTVTPGTDLTRAREGSACPMRRSLA